ncbi:MAG: hypothetical protein LBU32_22480 [Clostridiales bacterium]|jgi:hypothetical protein|nr:hypothetical protein [Clostridiales bacterium]
MAGKLQAATVFSRRLFGFLLALAARLSFAPMFLGWLKRRLKPPGLYACHWLKLRANANANRTWRLARIQLLICKRQSLSGRDNAAIRQKLLEKAAGTHSKTI